MGYDERTISDALGQKTIEMARRYARGADLSLRFRVESQVAVLALCSVLFQLYFPREFSGRDITQG
jgi:hypothetical protein